MVRDPGCSQTLAFVFQSIKFILIVARLHPLHLHCRLSKEGRRNSKRDAAQLGQSSQKSLVSYAIGQDSA